MNELTEQEKLACDEHIKQMLKDENDRAFKVVCTGLLIASVVLIIFSLV